MHPLSYLCFFQYSRFSIYQINKLKENSFRLEKVKLKLNYLVDELITIDTLNIESLEYI